MPETTVMEHVLHMQSRWSPQATGEFTSLLHDLILSAKIISRNVTSAGLVDILGGTGDINVQGEYVQKLDELANEIMIYRMVNSGSVCALGTEEGEDPIFVNSESKQGRYIIFFDPLDGSSNIDANVSIGTIFSIFRRPDDQPNSKSSVKKEKLELSDLLRAGVEQVAAGYFLYGPSTMMVYTTGQGVHGFTLDPSVGEFLLSHPDMKIPETAKYYSVNTGNYFHWSEKIQDAVMSFAKNDCSMRYVGSLVADFHRTLLYGGIFMYPLDDRRPDGKLRLVYEANPIAFLVEQAGGKAVDGKGERIMQITPSSLHCRTPFIVGSPKDVDFYCTKTK